MPCYSLTIIEFSPSTAYVLLETWVPGKPGFLQSLFELYFEFTYLLGVCMADQQCKTEFTQNVDFEKDPQWIAL